MRLRIAVVATALAVVSVLEAQSVDPALTAAIAGRDEAGIKRDPAAMAKYTADDYAAIAPNGVRTSKQQRLDQLKAPPAPGRNHRRRYEPKPCTCMAPVPRWRA